jgi:hypothetical protein
MGVNYVGRTQVLERINALRLESRVDFVTAGSSTCKHPLTNSLVSLLYVGLGSTPTATG